MRRLLVGFFPPHNPGGITYHKRPRLSPSSSLNLLLLLALRLHILLGLSGGGLLDLLDNLLDFIGGGHGAGCGVEEGCEGWVRVALELER